MVHKGKKKYLKQHESAETTECSEIVKTEDNDDNSTRPSESIENHKKSRNKRGKLIIRNLPFKGLSDEKLRNHFQEFGDIEEINILKKPDGRFVGCGFVQFSSRRSAARAIFKLNGKPFLERPIIIDWAIPKDTYLEKMKQNLKPEIKEEPSSDRDIEESLIEKDEDKEDKSSSENDSDKEDEVEEDDFDENDDNGEDEKYDFDDNEDFGDEEDIKMEGDDGPSTKKPRVQSNDVNEGKTVFIKNLPFTVTNEELQECMTQFGDVCYALVCVDRLTEYSKGTAFVKFMNKESADACIASNSKLSIEGTTVEIKPALSRDDVTNKKDIKPEKKDNRNLYLVKEGVVLAGTKAAEGMSAADMTKRLQIEKWKTQMLQNLNMFVARTRIVIHNLPASYDDQKLKDLILKYSAPGTKIKEARILRDRKKVNAAGEGLSKEIGFATFLSHEDALYALRNINNNPKIFTKSKRPIVAFSIENRAILNLKQKRMEKSRAKLTTGQNEMNSKLNKRQRRAIVRKKNLIEKRQLGKHSKKVGVPVPEKKQQQTPVHKMETQKKSKMEIQPQSKKPVKKRKNVSFELADQKRLKLVDDKASPFVGMISKPGKIVKMRAKFKFNTQTEIHKETIRREKKERKLSNKRKNEVIKQPAQKRVKRNFKVVDDGNFSKLVSSYKNKLSSQSNLKKWYE